MRDEVFKSNLVCAFIVLFFITGIQSLLPSARYTIHIHINTFNSQYWFILRIYYRGFIYGKSRQCVLVFMAWNTTNFYSYHQGYHTAYAHITWFPLFKHFRIWSLLFVGWSRWWYSSLSSSCCTVVSLSWRRQKTISVCHWFCEKRVAGWTKHTRHETSSSSSPSSSTSWQPWSI